MGPSVHADGDGEGDNPLLGRQGGACLTPPLTHSAPHDKSPSAWCDSICQNYVRRTPLPRAQPVHMASPVTDTTNRHLSETTNHTAVQHHACHTQSQTPPSIQATMGQVEASQKR